MDKITNKFDIWEGEAMNCEGLKDDHGVIVDNLLVGICIIQEGRFKYVNGHLLDMFGYDKPDAFIGKSLWDMTVSEDRSAVRSSYFKCDRHRVLPDRFTFRARKKDNSIIWIEMGIKSVSYRGKSCDLGNMVDITPSKMAEEALRESRYRYRIVLDEIEDGFGEIDLSGKVIFCNDSFIKIYGYPRDELIGLDYREYLDSNTVDAVYNAYNKVYVTGIPNKGFAYEIICKNGTRKIVENSISLIENSEGIPVGFRSIVRDITARRHAEEELAKHRSRLAAIFSSVRDAIITVDTNMVVIEANKAVKTLCGMSAEYIIGKVFTAVPNHCNKSCYRLIKETLERKTTIKEYRIECGPRQVVVVNSSPLLDQDGKFIGGVLVIRDITRLNDLEKELKERHHFHNIIGKSIGMQEIYSLLEDLANIETTVLVTGESGTGKELAAKAIHNGGNRAFKKFVAVNCSALAETLLESELFGHVKGAFTGAIRDQEGRFKAADGGTILLDEIGDISPKIQLKLLRILQEKVFERVGDLTPVSVDVRVIACTNRNLAEMVRNGEFREDLYYRLKVVEIKLPPLRERLDDIPLLVNHFCSILTTRFKKNIEGVSDEVLKAFMDYAWPGNIRELEHALERAFILCRDRRIMLSHLPSEIREYSRNTKAVSKKRLDDGPEETLLALNKTDWNKAKAARLLGIDRSTLYRRIQKYRISRPTE
ncbi:sigma 54-interacting transcriptional regulator [Desulforhopalus singaporensis]|uniref:PAS domain S-box-containing protein n=1 Tax=Desulforhopalus singaporensis TaxID=91360 RepID=A0A1H0V0I3_9BACT|nr:sigma 54-interacting transcriptional regulator [Desulforhopalus singaporensis]SDP71851.1 PAS domain S-box-containing protein [Desulforhopalus singaporensis]